MRERSSPDRSAGRRGLPSALLRRVHASTRTPSTKCWKGVRGVWERRGKERRGREHELRGHQERAERGELVGAVELGEAIDVGQRLGLDALLHNGLDEVLKER